MKKLLSILCIFFWATTIYCQTIVSITPQETLTKAQLTAKLSGFAAKYDIETFKVLYETPDTDGSIDTASGLLVIPISESKDQQFPIVAYQHGTSSSRDGVPSNIENGERLLPYFLAGQGYYATAADYLGLGESHRAIHPYIHSASEASAGIDLVLAAKNYMDKEGFSYNEQLFVTGYSQGGHAAMSMHKALETNPIEGLTVTAGSHMSGVYNLSTELLNATFSDIPYGFPSYAVWIIISYQSVYGNIYENLEDIFQEDILVEVTSFAEGKMPRSELNDILVDKLTKKYGASINRFLFTESYIETFQTSPEHPLRKALEDNDVFNWIPAVPMRLMYCMADDQVAFTNSTFTDSIMNANGAANVKALDVNSTANHGGCVVPAIFNTLLFFEGFAKREFLVSTKNIAQELHFQVNPNPAKDHINLSFNELENKYQQFHLQLININGQVVQKMTTNNSQNFTFPLNELPAGLYLMQVQTENGFWAEKVFIRD